MTSPLPVGRLDLVSGCTRIFINALRAGRLAAALRKLGVLPAVTLRDPIKSTVYLGSFCASSIVTMAVFAASYGEVTARAGGQSFRAQRVLRLCSAALSVVVGIVWLVLLRLGLLEQVFGD